MSRVFVGGLRSRITERDLREVFRKYGHIRDVALKDGYGFVEFDDYRDADDAIVDLNGTTLEGDRIRVEKARGKPHGNDKTKYWTLRGKSSRSRSRTPPGSGPSRKGKYRVVVRNVSSRFAWTDLKDLMSKEAPVQYADVHKYVKGVGVVDFINYEGMKRAIRKFDGYELNGRKITVEEFRPRSRSYTSSRSRSKSRNRSRS